MEFIIVPDELYNAINRKLDDAFKECPEAEADRDFLYQELLNAFQKYGRLPAFKLEKKS